MLRCAASFVVVAYPKVRLTHQCLCSLPSDELSEFGVGNRLFTDEPGKVNLLQDAGKNRIILRNSAQRLIQRVANIQVGGFVNRSESCLRRHKLYLSDIFGFQSIISVLGYGKSICYQ